jgi:RNA polymerase sigma-B factor
MAMTHLLQPAAADQPQQDTPAASFRAAHAGLRELTDTELATMMADPQCRDGARETLVSRYQSLVRNAAYAYRLPAQYREDLTQVGYLGLMKAINSFDPKISPELMPYARTCVTGEIKRFFRDKRWTIRVPRSQQELLLNARKTTPELAQELGGTPTDEQVAERLGVTADELRQAYRAYDAFAPESIDAPLPGAENRETSEVIGAEDDALERTIDLDAVQAHWPELPRDQQQVLTLRFYGNKTQAQVAERLGCSQMHVSRLQSRALEFLRRRLLAD